MRPAHSAVIAGVIGVIALVMTGCGAQRAIPDAPQPAGQATTTGAATARRCPPPMKQVAGVGIAIDYVDTFVLLGHDFMASRNPIPATWNPASPGPPAGMVRCTISAHQVDPDYQLHDGDATYLPVGTAIYLVKPKNGATEAVVRVDGHWVTYLLLANH